LNTSTYNPLLKTSYNNRVHSNLFILNGRLPIT